MTWSYAGAIDTSSKDRIRFLVGDTDTTDQLLSDEEINGALAFYDTFTEAVVSCCLAIAGKYARQVNTANTGGLKIEAAARYQHYKELAEELRTKLNLAAALGANIYVGGAKESDRDLIIEDDDYIDNEFSIGMDDYVDWEDDEDSNC